MQKSNCTPRRREEREDPRRSFLFSKKQTFAPLRGLRVFAVCFCFSTALSAAEVRFDGSYRLRFNGDTNLALDDTGFLSAQKTWAEHRLRLTPKTVRDIGKRYLEGGLDRALYERPRQGAKPLLSATERQRIIAMACSDAPEGRARWTVRLIAEQAIKRKLVPKVGRETIRILLESHDLKPWREKNVVRGRTQ